MTSTRMNGSRQAGQRRVLMSEGSSNAGYGSARMAPYPCAEPKELAFFEAETLPSLPPAEQKVWLEQRVSTLRPMFVGDTARLYFATTYPTARPVAFQIWNESLSGVYQGYKRALAQVRRELDGVAPPNSVDLELGEQANDVDFLLRTCKALVEVLLDELCRRPEEEEAEFLACVGRLLRRRARAAKAVL